MAQTLKDAQRQIGQAIQRLYPTAVVDTYASTAYIDNHEPKWSVSMTITIGMAAGSRQERLMLSYSKTPHETYSDYQTLCTETQWRADPEQYARRALEWVMGWLEPIE